MGMFKLRDAVHKNRNVPFPQENQESYADLIYWEGRSI